MAVHTWQLSKSRPRSTGARLTGLLRLGRSESDRGESRCELATTGGAVVHNPTALYANSRKSLNLPCNG